MNCLISDAPVWRAINTLLDDINEPAEVIVLTSDISATDLARHVLTHPAAAYCQLTVISERSDNVDPAVDLIDQDNYHHAWLTHPIHPGRPSGFNGNVVLVNAGGRVSAAVGSAPLVGNRWASEREVWTVLRDRCGCSPIALHELAELLCALALPDTDSLLDPRAAFALYTAARDIEATEAIDTNARLLSNHHRPIAAQLHQLITGPVDDLAIYSPTYGPGLRGIDTLIDIFQPAGVITLYATNRPHRNHRTIATRMSADGETRSIYVPRTWSRGASQNAAVIQWRTGSQTFALTGLSTIDSRALHLASRDEHADFEISVLSQVDEPLLSWPTRIDTQCRAQVLPLRLSWVGCRS